MKLYEIAHSRAGDKGDVSTLSVIAFRPEDYPLLERELTRQRVLEWFAPIGAKTAARYEVPSLGALNFVLEGTLGGGVTRSLAQDTHGKALSSYLLEMEL